MALCGYLAQQRGLLDFDAPVATVWPEFAANGKGDIVIRDVFAHRAGLMALDADLTLDDVLAWEPVIRAIEAQRPLWTPGTAFAYHALTFGWLTGEILRRATGKMPGALLADYLTDALGVNAWIGLPADQEHRVARMHALARGFCAPATASCRSPAVASARRPRCAPSRWGRRSPSR